MTAAPRVPDRPSQSVRVHAAWGLQAQFVMSTMGTKAQAVCPSGAAPTTPMHRVIQHR